MNIRKQAAEFYRHAAIGTAYEDIITEEAADRMGRAFEVCLRSQMRRNAITQTERAQALHRASKGYSRVEQAAGVGFVAFMILFYAWILADLLVRLGN